MIRKPIIDLTVLLATWMLAGAALGLSSDPDQPVNIEADAATVDENTGLTEYTGSVIMTQGSMRVLADKVTVQRGDEGVERVILLGNPARFRQRPDNSKEYVRATARKIEYLEPKNLLYLIDQASVRQGSDTFSGNRITYDTKRNRVQARKSKTGKERVKITFTPKKKSSSDSQPKK